MDFVHLSELLGIGRMEDLLFKCNRALIDRATDVKVVKEACSRCDQPNIIAWTYRIDGEQRSYRVSPVCSACINGKNSLDADQMKQTALENKWYLIEPDDKSGFKNYEATNQITELALKNAKDYTRRITAGEKLNLVMMGTTGTGKTHLATTVAKTAKAKGLSVAFIPSKDLFELIKQTFGNDRHKKKFMDDYISFDLVVIDDVGLETKKKDEVSWTITEWTNLVEQRMGKSTVFTTNFDDNSLPEVIGKRAFSRMYENAVFIDIFTDDYRPRKSLNRG